jgi:protein-tyrosine phosphatase
MFNSILVVCTGNICRSPIAERLLHQQLPGRIVVSAGIAGLDGYPADSMAEDIAQRHGISLDGHISRKVKRSLLNQSDLILVMELAHLNIITSIAPECRGKTMLFGQWLDIKEIPDPYLKSRATFEYVFELLDKASVEWGRRLT